ncbi:MAG: ATP-dependent 6-phosphofructokinase [Planctomycetota bacterium]|nr:ATP-dependent 6-phosphofructokinase [Planctomycetota bacterium]
MTRSKRIAILTGGGDCPGLNAVIRAVVRTAQNVHGWEVYGIKQGVEGFLLPGGAGLVHLTRDDVAGTLTRGGTILGASNRCDLFAVPQEDGTTRDMSHRVTRLFDSREISALIAVGGDGTMKMAQRLNQQGVPVVGVPKTIDNDIQGTDRTFGFDTAVGVVASAIDRLYSTAESHHRVMLVEVMGRDTGWIALHGGLAGGAEVILIPEIPYDPELIAEKVAARAEQGRNYSIVVVSEGARRPDGAPVYRIGGDEGHLVDRLGGVSYRVAHELSQFIDLEVRNIVLGHIQRGGTPSPFDRILASVMGQHAVTLVDDEAFGNMVAYKSGVMSHTALEEVTQGVRYVSPDGDLVRAARDMGVTFAAADGSDDWHTDTRRAHGAP